MKWFAGTVLFLGVCLILGCFAIDTCPACSKYSYEEQTLERMIKAELKVEQMKTDIQSSLINFLQVLEKYNNTLEEYARKYVDLKKRVIQEMEQKKVELGLLEAKLDQPLVAFNAYEPATTNLEANNKIRFVSVTLNVGNAYNPDTGIFTAPIDGLYQFSAHLCTTASNWVSFAIVLQDEIIALSYEDSDISCTSVSAVTLMKKGNEVRLKCINEYDTYQLLEDTNRRSSFMGTLIRRQA